MSIGETLDPPTTNIERLRGHLEDDTLAAALVDAYCANSESERPAALKAVAEGRLAEIRAALSRAATADGTD